jgi:hypothetical protein
MTGVTIRRVEAGKSEDEYHTVVLLDWLQPPSETFGHVVVHPAPAHRLRNHPMQAIMRRQVMLTPLSRQRPLLTLWRQTDAALQRATLHSPFFTRLPREVRNLVYDYLWCDGLHILQQYGRFRYTVTYGAHHDAQPPTHAAVGVQADHGRNDLPLPHATPPPLALWQPRRCQGSVVAHLPIGPQRAYTLCLRVQDCLGLEEGHGRKTDWFDDKIKTITKCIARTMHRRLLT